MQDQLPLIVVGNAEKIAPHLGFKRDIGSVCVRVWRTASQQYTALEKLVGIILLSSEMWIRIFLGMLQKKCGLSMRINVWYILGSTIYRICIYCSRV